MLSTGKRFRSPLNDEIGRSADERSSTGVSEVRPHKNNNQSDERKVRAGQLRDVGGACAAVSLRQEERGQTELPTAFNSPPPIPSGRLS